MMRIESRLISSWPPQQHLQQRWRTKRQTSLSRRDAAAVASAESSVPSLSRQRAFQIVLIAGASVGFTNTTRPRLR
eukprot:1838030-Pleurochrysis_carterae.AAC.1